jgi:hypothetical protein
MGLDNIVGGHKEIKRYKNQMIKFFRRIRQKLLAENRFGKYLSYAIGEIILVVIGILIAVQLNNLNQKRIRDAQIEILLDKVEEDLIHNIKMTNEIINYYHIHDSLARIVIGGKLTMDDYYRNRSLGNLILQFSIMNIITENIDKLLELEESIPSSYTQVINAAKELRRTSSYDENTWIAVRDQRYKNIEFLASNFLWFVKTDSSSIEKRYHYFLNDPDYKKRVANYWFKISHMALTTHYHRSMSLKTLGIIKTLRYDYNIDQLRQLSNSLGVNSYIQVDCKNETRRNSNYISPPERILIANLSNQPGQIWIKDVNGQLIEKKELDTQEYYIYQEFISGIDVDFFTVIEWHQSDHCAKKFIETRNGYLIIE